MSKIYIKFGLGTIIMTVISYTAYKFFTNNKKDEEIMIIPDHILKAMRIELNINDKVEINDKAKINDKTKMSDKAEINDKTKMNDNIILVE